MGSAPKCKCGCGREVSWSGMWPRWNFFVKGHNMKGKPLSRFHKYRIGKGNRGKTVSEEARLKMSNAHTGVPLSESHRLGLRNKKPISDETRQKLKDAWVRLKNSSKYGEYLQSVLARRTPSSLEVKFQSILDKHDLPYRYVGDGSFLIGKKNPDFVHSGGRKIAIEVYARFYKLKAHDDIEGWKAGRTLDFSEYGWDTIFFDETEVQEHLVLERIGGG